MKKVAVCIVVENMYYHTRYVIENLLAKTKVPIKLYINNINPISVKNNKLETYLWGLMEDSSIECFLYHNTGIEHKNISSEKNRMLLDITEELVCMFPANMIVAENWLEELYYNLETFPEAGILGIRSGNENCKLTPVLQRDDILDPVWFDPNNFVEGIQFFRNELLGPFTSYSIKKEIEAFADMEFSFQAVQRGCKNFYIKKQWAVRIPIETNNLYPKKTPEAAAVFMAMVNECINNDLKTVY